MEKFKERIKYKIVEISFVDLSSKHKGTRTDFTNRSHVITYTYGYIPLTVFLYKKVNKDAVIEWNDFKDHDEDIVAISETVLNTSKPIKERLGVAVSIVPEPKQLINFNEIDYDVL